jgi:hypothetical protein
MFERSRTMAAKRCGIKAGETIRFFESQPVLLRQCHRRAASREATWFDRAALGETKDFYRFFMAPGMGHCLVTGPGANVFNGPFNPGNPVDPDHDVVGAVDRWVDQGLPPNRIIATKFADDIPANGDVAFTRPLCPYPQVAKYKGSGNTARCRKLFMRGGQ